MDFRMKVEWQEYIGDDSRPRGQNINGLTREEWNRRQVEMEEANAKLSERGVPLRIWTCNHLNYVALNLDFQRVGSIGRCQIGFNAERDDRSGMNKHIAVVDTLRDAATVIQVAINGYVYQPKVYGSLGL